MFLNIILYIFIIFFTGGFFGLLFNKKSNIGQIISVSLITLASITGIITAIISFFYPITELNINIWKSMGSFTLSLDRLAGFYLILIFLIGGLGAFYGLGYWKQSEHQQNGKSLNLFWGFLISGMILVVLSKHCLSFILGWEIMAISAFLLIITEDHKEETRKNAIIYLISTHICTLLIFLLFVLWKYLTGSFILEPIKNNTISPIILNILFFLIFIAFGLKAGFVPLHFWLPEAHASAPTHVSAILSGVMIKMGIFGIIRIGFLLQNPPVIWGIIVLISGLVSGVIGVVFAIAQHDIKRLLAYHSVENIGIILIGLGLAFIGKSFNNSIWYVLGLSGALLHIWNHGIFKSLLFFGAGSVIHSSGTRDIDKLGGLAKKMKWTSLFFLIGSIAISGLPPLNGFISEFFIYLSFLNITISNFSILQIVGLGVPILAIIGALATACFVKVFSVVFLGNTRSDILQNKISESSIFMLIPMFILALICFIIGFFPKIIFPILQSVSNNSDILIINLFPYKILSNIFIILTILIIVIILLYKILINKSPKNVTWDCGYANPSNRMQYTSSSFAQSIIKSFNWVLKTDIHKPVIKEYFPDKNKFESHTNELVLDRVIIPLFNKIKEKLGYFKFLQPGIIQSYVFYILIILIIFILTLIPYKELFEKIFLK